VTVLVIVLVCGPGARAQFTPATLLSGAPPLQFEEANSPAFAQDGDYVAFRGTLAGVSGIYRRNLQSGEVTLVAGSNADPELNAPDAAGPSISADGRYIAFTSAHDLDGAADTGSGCPQVYMRDMARELAPDRVAEEKSQRGPYTLASAENGTSHGLTYERPCSSGSATQLVLGGAQAAAGAALSANGDKVAFVVLSRSSLTGPCSSIPQECPTEPSQVAVRDISAETTTLVSATPQGEPTPGGGAFPSAVSEKRPGGPGRGTTVNDIEPTASSAAISAAGGTVAWQGTNVPAQVPSASDVSTEMAQYGGADLEVEPLWRDIGAGSAATTKRLLAGAGLNFYFAQSHQISGEGIEGGAVAPVRQAFAPPALSADGSVVATTSNAPTAANTASYQYLDFNALPPADAYVVRVPSAPSAPPQVTPLTATPDFAARDAIIDGIQNVAISPDGTRVAFNTRRASFAVPAPTLISPPVSEGAFSYTYDANLALGTLQRVTSTYDSAAPNGEPGLLSFAGDNRSLALTSSAANLIYGDATSPGVSQVYSVQELPLAEQPTPTVIGAPPTVAPVSPAWNLAVNAAAQRDGSVLVTAQTPGAGKLVIMALAQLPGPAGRKAGKSTARRKGRQARVRLVTQTVARAQERIGDASSLSLRLRAAARDSSLIASRLGLYVVLSVDFAAPGHPTLSKQIGVTLRRHVAPARPRAKR
jgi:hypothetical protein